MQIEAGQLDLAQFEAELGAWVRQLVERIRAQRGKVVEGMPVGTSEFDVACQVCGAPMRRIKGARGYFWGCTAYRSGCRSTLPDADGAPVTRAATTGRGDMKGDNT